MKGKQSKFHPLFPWILILPWVLFTLGCASAKGAKGDVYADKRMDFTSLKSMAVMPFENLAANPAATGRVRDIFMVKLLASGAVYVVPPGEVAYAASRLGIQAPWNPTPEEVVKLAGLMKVNGVVTGVLREYGEVRSGSAISNVVSVGIRLFEGQTGKVVWSASSTKGGVGVWDRLFGGGGEPMNNITEKAVDDLLDNLFK